MRIRLINGIRREEAATSEVSSRKPQLIPISAAESDSPGDEALATSSVEIVKPKTPTLDTINKVWNDEYHQRMLDLVAAEEDKRLPSHSVTRIMKEALPENAKIGKAAKELMQECATEFIAFITSEANDKCKEEMRVNIHGMDIISAMENLSFENYAEALKIHLAKYRQRQHDLGEYSEGDESEDQ